MKIIQSSCTDLQICYEYELWSSMQLMYMSTIANQGLCRIAHLYTMRKLLIFGNFPLLLPNQKLYSLYYFRYYPNLDTN